VPRPEKILASRVVQERECVATFAIELFGPKYSEPIAIALSSSGCVHSLKTKVPRWRTGNVGINRPKNMCKHSSRKTDVRDVASTAAVTDDDLP
jgi:hypothetical protein